MARYEIRIGSQSGNDRFQATVIDTTRPVIVRDGVHYKSWKDGLPMYESIAECFDVHTALLIVAALNLVTARQQST